MSLNRPKLYFSKWAENGKRFDVPDSGADTANGRADIQTGFPDTTMKSVINGGVPPWGQDHNGILNRLTQDIQWTQAGGYSVFDENFAKQIGGYSYGSIVATITQNAWVYWISLEDNNFDDPTKLEVNKASQQGKWRRYPVIEAKDGATLYYNDDGELAIFTAQNTNYKYVSWSTGNDITGNGSILQPFKTIDKAITVSPSVGNITIYLDDQNDHYWIGYGDVEKMIDNATGQWDIDTLPGKLYTEDDHQATNPDTISFGYLNVGTRNVAFSPYQAGKDPSEDLWNIYMNKVQEKTVDGALFYSADKATLEAIGLRRPKIILCWQYGNSKPKDNWISTYIRWCGLSGIANSYSVLFNAIEFKIAHLDKLDETALGNNIGWNASGYNCVFNGCIIGDQCHSGNSFMFGAGETNSSSLIFKRSNFFADPVFNKDNNNLSSEYKKLNKQLVTIQTKGPLDLTSDEDSQPWEIELKDETYTIDGVTKNFMNVRIMQSNVQSFLGHSQVYAWKSLDTIAIGSTSFVKYKFINPNFEIK